ncbi:MAG: T9SS type A sorting domain-containing protein, partial [Rhodothermales bacterium]
QTQEVLNLQVWSVAPQYTAELVREVIHRIEAQGPVTFLNISDSVPSTPMLYVKDGRYDRGRFLLRMANGSEAASVVLRGSTARTETESEHGLRTDFEQTLTVPGVSEGQDAVDVTLDLGQVFDAIIEIEHTASGSLDKLYYSDGAWSYAVGQQATVTSFQTLGDSELPPADGRFVAERSATIAGSVTDWVSLFKFLRPGGQPVDLSSQRYLEFTARGQGMVQVVVEKASIKTWDQFSYLINLTPENRSYQIPFNRFAQSAGNGGLTTEDVTLVAFYVIGDRQSSAPFEMHVEKLAFGGATNVAAEDIDELPDAITLQQNYPNPFNPATTIEFSLPSASRVRLAVYDMLGREVAVLVNGALSAGTHGADFNASRLPSGAYMYQLRTEGQVYSKTMV